MIRERNEVSTEDEALGLGSVGSCHKTDITLLKYCVTNGSSLSRTSPDASSLVIGVQPMAENNSDPVRKFQIE
ncbi:hypothetical protein TNCV_1471461 [Trichonephila clavipes]|nr:hypothetical protein TNCV_1471461 [Trichonephila clavipes]